MAYRDRLLDPRIVELEALIAVEPALRTKIVPLRIELDDTQAQLDVRGSQLAEAAGTLAKRREGGVLSTVGGWFGKPLEECEAEVAALKAEHAALSARVAELVSAESALWKEITRSVEARAELLAIRERAIEAMRGTDGPHGDEMRALDADDEHDRAQRSAIVRVLDIVDLAQTAVFGIQTILGDLVQLTGTMSSVRIVFELIDSPLTTPATTAERDSCRERLADAIGYAGTQLQLVVGSYDTTDCEWFAKMPQARLLELAASAPAKPVEKTEIVQQAAAVIDCLLELSGGLVGTRDRLARNEAARAARREELVGGGMR